MLILQQVVVALMEEIKMTEETGRHSKKLQSLFDQYEQQDNNKGTM
jgi:hypothetical protein